MLIDIIGVQEHLYEKLKETTQILSPVFCIIWLTCKLRLPSQHWTRRSREMIGKFEMFHSMSCQTVSQYVGVWMLAWIHLILSLGDILSLLPLAEPLLIPATINYPCNRELSWNIQQPICVDLRILASYKTKTAKICNFWTFLYALHMLLVFVCSIYAGICVGHNSCHFMLTH